MTKDRFDDALEGARKPGIYGVHLYAIPQDVDPSTLDSFPPADSKVIDMVGTEPNYETRQSIHNKVKALKEANEKKVQEARDEGYKPIFAWGQGSRFNLIAYEEV